MARKPVKKQKENPAGCTGKGKQSKKNIGEEKRMVYSAKFKLCDKTRRRCEGKKEVHFIKVLTASSQCIILVN